MKMIRDGKNNPILVQNKMSQIFNSTLTTLFCWVSKEFPPIPHNVSQDLLLVTIFFVCVYTGFHVSNAELYLLSP